MRELYIAGRRVADDEPPFIVAEIGHNHGGSLETCRNMIRVAKQCGVDAVKLQKRDNKTLFTHEMYEAPYNSEHAFGATYGEHREALEFGWDEYVELKAYAESLGLIFFATAFEIPSADFLVKLGVPAIKIASGDLRNEPLLEHCACLPLIVSTGGHNWDDVYQTYRFLYQLGADFALLQATAIYPVSHADLNLRVIPTYRGAFLDTVIGLSDHQDGISMAPVAYMLGARIFEKHFTLSRAAKGSDNAFSLEPEPMRRMVNDLRGVADTLGDGVKRRLPGEESAMTKMGKSLVAAKPLTPGHILIAEDIAIKSPGGGIPPYELRDLIGRRLLKEMRTDERLSWEIAAPSGKTQHHVSVGAGQAD